MKHAKQADAPALSDVATLRKRARQHVEHGAVTPSYSANRETVLRLLNEEQLHATEIAKRILQLDGKPDFNPASLAERSHAEYVECDTLSKMILENLVAERIAIESYREMIDYIGNDDPTTSRLLKWILAKEEEQAEELSSLLKRSPQMPMPVAM